MHTKIIDSSVNKPAFGSAEISTEFARPNAKRIRHSEINKVISPETNMEHSRPKRLCSVKSTPALGQIFQNKDKKNLFESLNIMEPEKKSLNSSRPIRSSPTKLSRNSSCSDLKNKKCANQASNRNSFTCLRNLGSTCYINCIIQVMRYTPGFVLSIDRLNKQIEFLKSLKNTNIDGELNRNNDIAFVKNLHELLVDMSKIEQSDRRPIYTPRKFVNTVWTLLSFWSDGSQQDAHEFLQYTIHFINECDLSLRKLHQQYQFDQTVDEAKPRRVARKATSTKPAEKLNEKISLTTNNPLLLVTDESSSSSVSSTCSSSASSTSAVSAPIFRLRSAANTTTSTNTATTIHSETNLLRTPTKGGASSFNIAVLDSNLNSKKDSDEELIFRAMIKSDPVSSIKKTSPILTDSDLVSKRLKETLYSSSFKLDSSRTNILNDSECIIIADSDDEVYFMDDNEEMPVARPSQNLNEHYELKKCYVLLERIKIDQLRVPSVIEKTSNVDKSESKPIKRVKRSKTAENSIVLMDLDAITTVSIGRNNSSSSCESLSLRKLRSNNSASCLKQSVVSTPPSPAELLRKNSVGSGYTCEMDKLFKGSSVTVTQCLECENLRKCPESFYDRSIPLETTENEDESSCWIAKCLSNESYLNENSKYMCDQCASKQEAKIETMYTHMPSILVLHLLSYGITSSDDGNLNTRKLSNRLRLVNYFDFECDRQDVCAPKSDQLKHKFKLFAVVMHSGVSLNSGHYTAFVNYKIICQNLKNFDNSLNLIEQSKDISEKNCLDAEWLHFDDTKVKSLSNTEFQRKIIDSNYDSPYILFYVKDSI